MHSDWQSFLAQAGAHVESGRVVHFGDAQADPTAAASDVISDLSHQALIRVTGDDARDFLQGQLTNDAREVNADQHQITGQCTPKGRLLALFRLFQRDGAYFLQLPTELAAATAKRLRMYVLRSKVSIDDVSDQVVRFGLAGPQAESLLAAALGQGPARSDGAATLDGVTVLRLPGSTARFELIGEPSVMQPLWRALATKARPVGASVWSWLDIHAGLPAVYSATTESFVPQMLNLHALPGVSFRKGCYTGQEIVARMQYLGKLKRRMFLAHVDGDVAPAPGDELFAAQVESGQGTGTVVDAQAAPGGGYDLLAVILISAVENGASIHLRDAQGPRLQVENLPYAVDELSA